jgi:pSer/pThr/pTyr-binding forkhead associated (FHA) protein
LSIQQIEVIVRKPGQSERRAVFGVGVSHFGRAEDNDLVLTDIGVSRRHARMLVQPDGVWIEDLGSGNGTYFLGDRVSRQLLKHGDEVVIDPFLLRFEIPTREESEGGGLTGELEDADDDDTVRVPSESLSEPQTRTGPIRPHARLVTLNGQRLAPSYPVRADGLTIGRSDARDVILFDPAASRNHTRLEMVGDDVWLRDDSSGNGTFVNALRVREQCLRHGDRVRVGSTEFRFEILEGIRAEPRTLPPRPREVRVVRQLDRAPSAPPPSTWFQVPQGVAVGALGGLAVFAMMVIGGMATLYIMNSGALVRTSGPAPALVSVTESLSPDQQRTLKEHIDRGESFFSDGKYMRAAAQFYAGLKVVPEHPAAERMGMISCEYLLLDTLHDALALRVLPEVEQQRRRTSALKLGRQALGGRADVNDAKAALREVLVFLPADSKTSAMLMKLTGE